MGSFDFSGMMGNHDQRVVACYEDGSGDVIDTARVTDSDKDYETAILRNGRWTPVELYDTKEEAQAGHDQWVKLMQAGKLPKTLRDVGTSGWKQLTELL